jgi:hypothetical protein
MTLLPAVSSTPTRRPVQIQIAGAGRGYAHMLPFLADLDRTSNAIAIRPTVISPRPDELERASTLAASHGLAIATREAKIEHVLTRGTTDDKEPLILLVDRAAAAVAPLEVAAESNLPVLLYMFLQLPGMPLALIASVLTEYDRRTKVELAMFFRELDAATGPGGSSTVFGGGAPAANVESEPNMRAWLNEHARENLLKVVVGLPPNAPPLQIVVGGEARTLLIEDSRDGFRTTEDLTAAVRDHLRVPLERGKAFVVAEVGPAAIRFHDGWLRTTGELVVKERPVRPASPEPDMRDISRTNPVRTSD